MGKVNTLKNKKFKIALLVIIVICIVPLVLIHFKLTSKVITSEEYTILNKGENINSINVKGEIESDDIIDVYSTSNATVKKVEVKVGDMVKKGDVLAALDTADLESSIKQLEETIRSTKKINKEKMDKAQNVYENALSLSEEGSNGEIIRAEAALKTAELDLENKQNILDYNKDLYKYGEISEQDLNGYEDDLENAKNTYDTAFTSLSNLQNKVALNLANAKNDYEIAKAGYEDNTQELSLERKKQQLADCTIICPSDGVITTVNAVGGNPSTGNLFQISNLDSIIATLKVKEVDIEKIKAGQEVRIKTDSNGNKILKGEVIAIKQSAKESEDALSLKDDSNDEEAEYEVKVQINDSKANLKVGMKTNADIIIDKKEDVFTVPSESIFKNTEDKDCIYIAEPKDGKYVIKEVPVTLGSQSDTCVEIINDILKNGDIVLNSPLSYTKDSKINLQK